MRFNLLKIGIYTLLLFLSLNSVASTQPENTPAGWAALGFPLVMDRTTRVPDDSNSPVYQQWLALLDKIPNAIKTNDDHVLSICADIFRYYLTPSPKTDETWYLAPLRAIWLFKGTKYAQEMINLAEYHLKNDHDEGLRALVAIHMGTLGDKNHVQDILPLLASKDEIVRKMATKALIMRGYNVPSDGQ